MAETILLAMRLPRAFHARLAEHFEVLGPVDPPFESAARALPGAAAARVRAIVSMGSVAIPARALELFPRLGLIACLGSGYEGVPLAAARERGIAVTHSPGANAAAVADLAIGLMIAATRDMSVARDWLRGGNFAGNAGRRLPPARGLAGRRVGIYGLGEIGARIARRAEAMEMQVAYHNRRPRRDVAYPWHATLGALARWADVLMVAVRADTSNRHAVDRAVLADLGPDGFVINISRGSVIDEAALAQALREGVIAGAGLDVFEHEPQVTPALFDLPRVALTPHIGGNTMEAQLAMQDMVLENLAAFFAGGALPNLVPA